MSAVLYVSTFLSTAGANRSYCEDLADRLEAGGTVVTRTSSHPGRIARLADILATVWRTRRRYEVAIVDVFSGAAFAWAEAACFELRRLGKPFVLALHGGQLPDFAARWPRRVRRLLASAARVTAPSGYLRDRLAHLRRDIEVLPNAIDARALPFRLRLSLRPRLVWIRAFHALYNPTLAIDAVARISRRFPDVTLTMVGPDKGDGSHAAAVRAAQVEGVADRVHFVGGVPRREVVRHLADADVLLNTTDADNTPLSVLEAAGCGLPIVSTSVGGIPFLLDHERTALLVPPRDADAMTAAVTRLLDTPALAAQLSASARDLAASHDWTPVLARWQQRLREVRGG